MNENCALSACPRPAGLDGKGKGVGEAGGLPGAGGATCAAALAPAFTFVPGAATMMFVAATGVTTGALLRGVRYVNDGAVTDSIVMRSRSGTVRRIEARHQLSKLRHFTGREY